MSVIITITSLHHGRLAACHQRTPDRMAGVKNRG